MSDAPATFLFADIAGFTALTEAHGDEQAVAVVDAFCAAVDVELPAGGTRVKSIGDAVMLRVPDPGDAILLGLRMTRDAPSQNGMFGVRVSLHYGTAVEREGDYFGATVRPTREQAPSPERFARVWGSQPSKERGTGRGWPLFSAPWSEAAETSRVRPRPFTLFSAATLRRSSSAVNDETG